jgi:hypothetical protein
MQENNITPTSVETNHGVTRYSNKSKRIWFENVTPAIEMVSAIMRFQTNSYSKIKPKQIRLKTPDRLKGSITNPITQGARMQLAISLGTVSIDNFKIFADVVRLKDVEAHLISRKYLEISQILATKDPSVPTYHNIVGGFLDPGVEELVERHQDLIFEELNIILQVKTFVDLIEAKAAACVSARQQAYFFALMRAEYDFRKEHGDSMPFLSI